MAEQLASAKQPAGKRETPPLDAAVVDKPEEKAPQPHQIVDAKGNVTREKPWIIRTYAGHSSAKASNELYRSNLSRGQTGLSIAFDLATQCGYDSDDSIARPEVGKVGVPISVCGEGIQQPVQ